LRRLISHVSLPEAVRLTVRRRILNNELAAGERLIEASGRPAALRDH